MKGRESMKQTKLTVAAHGRNMRCLVLKPSHAGKPFPGILWIHGGGYALGMAGMVHMSCGKLLARRYGAVLVSPAYRLSWKAPYPAALQDCYAALQYMWDHAEDMGIDRTRIIVGGESAGGGLAAAVCLLARERGQIHIAMQIPLYPMLDCRDTESSRDNHGRVWNTKRNHWGWARYLGTQFGPGMVSKYASPALETDCRGLPPCYTFVSEGEPFYRETVDYVNRLKAAGVAAAVDVWPGNVHAFDMLCPWLKRSRAAKRKLCNAYAVRICSGTERSTES